MNKILLTLIFSISMLGCNGIQENKNNETRNIQLADSSRSDDVVGDTIKEENNGYSKAPHLENTVWIDKIFEAFPECIDTLKFKSASSGFFYSCEHDISDSISYEVFNDTLLINKWDYDSEMDISGGKVITSKYFLKIDESTLKIFDIQHKYNEGFQSVDKKYLTMEFKKIQ